MDIGTQIEHYVIVDHIGRGGMADVWAARDTRLNRMVAVKTIARNLSDEADYLARFESEAQTIAELEHPHILPIYAFGDLNHQLYIVMRYVSGGTLFDRLVDGPIPPDEVLRIGRALASALDHAHNSDVVHLDLKPLNVLMDASGIPYLADFGLAARVGAEGITADSASGSIGYMAPEQMSGSTLDRRADIFSFGVMLYHMFTGELPFGENSLTGLQIMSGMMLPDPAEKVADLPGNVVHVLRRSTALEAEERFESAGSLVDTLVETLEQAPGVSMVDMSALDFDVGEVDPEALARLEAQDLFFRAQHVWGQGQGQFVLGMTDFMLVNGYYQPGGELADTLDEDGRRMMLRGAIEYDHEIAQWQSQVVDQDAQREVCLHILRSGLPPARARAISMLSYLPDADSPVIVRRVARGLGAESDKDVRAASVALMGARGGAPTAWRAAAYAPAIDERLAEEALSDAPEVAEAAARTVGRLRSGAGVAFLAARKAVGALALVRDEAPDLPRELPWSLRARAFLALTWRKLSLSSMTWRFVSAAASGMLAMGGIIFALYPFHQAIMLSQRLLNTFGVGVPFGLLVGLLVLLAVEFPDRLQNLWAWWVRVPLFWMLGSLAAIVPFIYYYMGYQNISDPPWGTLVFSSLAMAGAFVLGSALRLSVWARVLLMLVIMGGLPLASHHLYIDGTLAELEQQIDSSFHIDIGYGDLLSQPLVYFGTNTQAQALSLLMGVTVSLGAYLLDIPHGWLALVGGLTVFAVQAVVGLVFRLLWDAPTDAAGVLLGGLGAVAAFAVGGVVAAVMARGGPSARHVGLGALAGGAVYSLVRFIVLPPAYGALPASLHDLAAGLYLAQAVGGPLLAGAVAIWVRAYARERAARRAKQTP